MRVRVLLSRFWHWWQWYWLFLFRSWQENRSSPDKYNSVRGNGLRYLLKQVLSILNILFWILRADWWFLVSRYFVPTHELIVDRNAWLTCVNGGAAGVYNPFYRCAYVFLNKYQAKIPNYWIISYHHEILHKVIRQVEGLQAGNALDNLWYPNLFNEYIGAHSHFFVALTLTYDEWRFGIMRRMSVAGESEVFGG